MWTGPFSALEYLAEAESAAKREGYHTVLVPRGQLHTSEWNLIELGFQLNISVKEVDTVDEAYQFMTGNRL